jgi:hypothetical protein
MTDISNKIVQCEVGTVTDSDFCRCVCRDATVAAARQTLHAEQTSHAKQEALQSGAKYHAMQLCAA